MTQIYSRRPITSRNQSWAKNAAKMLKHWGIRPNTISVASCFFAAFAAICLYLSAQVLAQSFHSIRWMLLVGVILGILGRLICNLLDGMVAVEGGLKTLSGEVFNDLPDRISDLVIFVAMGSAASSEVTAASVWLQAGWAAASLAILTAYIRFLGASCGAGHFFSGPMAKQHRMAVSIGATVASGLLEPRWLCVGSCYRLALVVVIIGASLTCINRTLKIVQKLEQQR